METFSLSSLFSFCRNGRVRGVWRIIVGASESKVAPIIVRFDHLLVSTTAAYHLLLFFRMSLERVNLGGKPDMTKRPQGWVRQPEKNTTDKNFCQPGKNTTGKNDLCWQLSLSL